MNETETPPVKNETPIRTIEVVEIQKYIPHRYPFLLVDRVDVIEKDKRAIGTKCVTINEDFFNGHFPGHPIMPGVLILEAIAQTALILMASSGNLEGKMGYFLGIDGAKFRQAVRPGSVLKLKVEMLRAGSRAGKLRGEAYLSTPEGETLATEAEMSFAIVPKAA